MNDWTQKRVGSTNVWQTTVHVPLETESITQAFRPIWVDCGRFLSEPPAPRIFDILRVEIFEGSGRIRIYPMAFSSSDPPVSGCEITLPSVQRFILESDSMEETPETIHLLETTLQQLAVGIAEAASTDLCSVFGKPRVRIDVCFSGHDEPLYTRILEHGLEKATDRRST